MTEPKQAMLEDAIALALEVHRGAKDKGGSPYILHPLRVMARQRSLRAQIVAVLHDVVEDGDISLEDLLDRGFEPVIVDAIEAVTRRNGESYEDFVDRAGVHPIGRAVKLADLEDNLDVRRLAALDERAVKRLERYRRAWAKLSAIEKTQGHAQ